MIQVHVNKPPPVSLIQMSAPVRQACVASIPITNGLDTDVSLTIGYGSPYLHGPDFILLRSQASGSIDICFAPVISGDFAATVSVAHPKVSRCNHPDSRLLMGLLSMWHDTRPPNAENGLVVPCSWVSTSTRWSCQRQRQTLRNCLWCKRSWAPSYSRRFQSETLAMMTLWSTLPAATLAASVLRPPVPVSCPLARLSSL